MDREFMMSIRYCVDQGRHLLLTVMEGAVTMEDLFAYVDAVISEFKCIDFCELITIGESTTSLTSNEISELASRTNALFGLQPANYIRTAIVAPSNLGFGLSRVFQSHQNRSSEEFAVFKELKQATDWLELEQSLDFEFYQSLSEHWTYIGPALVD